MTIDITPETTRLDRGRCLGTAAACLLFALTIAGCGAIAEEAIEQAVEADTGEEVEIDFDSEDGTLSIEGDDGEEFSFDIDADGEGSVMSGSDEDGNTFEMVTGEGVPDDWPGELPIPPGTIVTSTMMAENDNRILTLVSEVDDSASAHDSYVDQLTSNGFTVGSTSSFESDGQSSKFTEVNNSSWTGMISSGSDGTGPEQLVVNFQSATE